MTAWCKTAWWLHVTSRDLSNVTAWCKCDHGARHGQQTGRYYNLNNKLKLLTLGLLILKLENEFWFEELSILCPNEPELWSSELRTQVLLWTQLVQWLQSAFCSLAFRHLEYRFEATKKIQIPKENSNCNLYTNIIINYIYSSKKG